MHIYQVQHFIVSYLVLILSTAFGNDLDRFFSEGEAFQSAHVGISVIELPSGKIVYERAANHLFIPASLMKIVTGICALQSLGEEFRFVTKVAYEGQVRDKVLEGNLWVVGGGDPTLSLAEVQGWKERLAAEGIEAIQGKICLDLHLFEKAAASPYWNFEDIGNYYGAAASALTVNENYYEIAFQSGKELGEKATILSCNPSLPWLEIENEVVTGKEGSGDQVSVFGMEYNPKQYYRGTVPKSEQPLIVKAAIPDPAKFLGDQLTQQLKPTQGIEIVREERKVDLTPLFTLYSPSLQEIVKKMELQSNNCYAEHLLKAMGKGSSLSGRQKITAFLKELGFLSDIRDGSGLARSNLLRPKDLTKLLATFPKMEEYLPVKEKSLRAKTGSMSQVINLAGYLTLSNQKKLVFAIFCNNYPGARSEVQKEMAAFLEHLEH